MIQGKRFILWLFGVMIVVSILFLLGTAKLSHGKADICRGYYDPQQQATCAATATAGPPPDLIQYH